MPSREDETFLNMNPHPSSCNCPECVKKRKRIKYPYPAEIECPSCGNISLYFSDRKKIYRCVHEHCLAEGKTIEEISERKAKRDRIFKRLWNGLSEE
jgi:hypothetical protein